MSGSTYRQGLNTVPLAAQGSPFSLTGRGSSGGTGSVVVFRALPIMSGLNVIPHAIREVLHNATTVGLP